MRQEEGVWHRLDVVARSISPFFVTLLLVLFALLPLHIADLSPIVPALALIGVFFWSVHRPDLMPIWAVFLIGLVQDVLTGGVIGPGIIGLLVAHALVVWQHRFFLAASFAVIWFAFMLVAAAALAVTWLLTSIAMMTLLDPGPVFFQYLVTLAFYPCLAWAFLRGQRLFQR
ncbi:rod shape-determining protein MreD [Pelagibius marinus]|uniref:rod shape-determining protein MreD n=1 Tax=Pelagibius marinus TaxID=2762760 RepID=UPI001872DE83|nr:rod shape-determining protein MreD [Pelagibius marinus]